MLNVFCDPLTRRFRLFFCQRISPIFFLFFTHSERRWCSSPHRLLVSGANGDYRIDDRYIRASTQLNEFAGPERARLDLENDLEHAGGWCPTVRDIEGE